jgi:hypothetical protein
MADYIFYEMDNTGSETAKAEAVDGPMIVKAG